MGGQSGVRDVRTARSVQGGSYGGGPVAFVQVLEQWRAEGDMRGLLLNT